jgi:hypothetical protein
MADLDGDGRLDLAVANSQANSVSVLLGHGDGTFGPKTDFPTGDFPQSVAIGDVNGDGRPDLVVANAGAGSTVSVLLGHGDGTFGPKTDFATGFNPFSVAIGDLNRDGKPDLVVANASFNTVSVLLGRGDGTFGPKTDFPTGDEPQFVAIGDLNGDGRPDVVVVNSFSNTVSVWLGNGNGSFALRTDFGTGSFPLSVAIGDLNSDGHLDLAVTNGGANTVSVLLGNGDGTFGPKTDFGTGDFPFSGAIGDLNGDGRPDLAVANANSNTVCVLLNTGGGIPTPITLGLIDARAEPGRVELSWYGAAMAGVGAIVYRQSEGTRWSSVTSIVGDGTGKLRFEDVNVRPGTRYGYRLAVGASGSERYYGETWISVPGDWVLTLAAPSPNPATDRLVTAFTLESAARARLEVLDVAGRMVDHREVGSLGAGQHVVAFTEAARWRPGIYLVRLTQGPHSLISRACIVR